MKIKATAVAAVAFVLVVVAVVYYFRYLEPRPEDTTAPRVYTEDAYAVDYCELPALDGSGLTADEIPKAYTRGCPADRWPAPILQACTEPLPPEAADLRGLWQAEEGQVGHLERIEQCGNRMIVVGRTFIHDFRTNGRLADGANDVNPRNCTRVRASMAWEDNGTLVFKGWGLIPVVSRRLQDVDTLLWEYPGQPDSRLKRVCRLPADEYPSK
jgi:hypothetical protein